MSNQLLDDIARLSDLLTANGWTELRVRVGDTEILLSTDPATPSLGAAPVAVAAAPAPTATATATLETSQPAAAAAVDPGWIAVPAPNLGTFYRSPKPGSPPFVEIGDTVTADTEICLLEVMKLFTSVKAGKAGTVRQICADDAELVEAGRVLFYLSADDQ
jgi:acetyl-CoA carboxylase biotin carboxyl carrier protein